MTDDEFKAMVNGRLDAIKRRLDARGATMDREAIRWDQTEFDRSISAARASLAMVAASLRRSSDEPPPSAAPTS